VSVRLTPRVPPDGDHPHEECGVFGVFGHPRAAELTLYGLYALQHRGQESAGIASTDRQRIHVHKDMGLVSEVFSNGVMGRLSGSAAIGHVRYSTFGASNVINAQPLVVRCRQGRLALAHNGNIVNAGQLRSDLERRGSIFQTAVDTEVAVHLMARSGASSLVEALVEALRQVHGGYAIVLLTEDRLYACRDPHGIRPLSMGRLRDAVVFASESCAFDIVGAEFVRDVAPGEVVIVDRDGVTSRQAMERGEERLCIFEYIYFARPDSNLAGKNVHSVRKELGRRLARHYPCEADIVIGVPDSSLSAATGCAEASGIPYEVGLIKNRYIGRTFIQPTQEMRSSGVRIKLNALRQVVKGRRLVLVDDSIVRGTTSRHIVRMLRAAGAREVHLRIASPPYRHSCYYGIDTSAVSQLIAARMDVPEIARFVEADSLAYLGQELLTGAVEAGGPPAVRGADEPGNGRGYCCACFDGNYPVDVSEGARFFDWDCGD